jgi:hypothetical protein
MTFYTVTPACLQGQFSWKLFFHPFTLRQCLSLLVRNVYCRQKMAGSYFLIKLTIISLLIGELRPLTFSVNTERYILFPVILLFLWNLLFSYSSSANLLAWWVSFIFFCEHDSFKYLMLCWVFCSFVCFYYGRFLALRQLKRIILLATLT